MQNDKVFRIWAKVLFLPFCYEIIITASAYACSLRKYPKSPTVGGKSMFKNEKTFALTDEAVAFIKERLPDFQPFELSGEYGA